MMPTPLERIVYAKLRSTGEYALAGWTNGLSRAAAEEAVNQCTTGAIDLEDNEWAFSSLVTADGTRALVGTTKGGWLDGAGRPWLHQHIVLVPSGVFSQYRCDPFSFLPAVCTVEVFDAQSSLQTLPSPTLADADHAAAFRRALEEVGADARLPAALDSVFSAMPAYWVSRGGVLDLLAACIAALPLGARHLLTFVSRAAQPPRLAAKVLVANRQVPGLGDGRADVLDLDGVDDISTSASRSGGLAAAVTRWISSREWSALEQWHRVADEFILNQGPDPTHEQVASAMDRSMLWVSQIEPAAAMVSGQHDALANALRKAAELQLRPPPVVVCVLFEKCTTRPSVDAVAEGLALTATSCDRGWEPLAAAAGRRWAGTPSEPGEWAALLDRSQGVVAGAAARIVEEAAGESLRLLRQGELVSIAAGLPDDREWSACWPKVIESTWERSRSGWPPQALLECVIRPGRDGLTLPSASWMEQFGQHYDAETTSPPAREIANAATSVARGAPNAVAQLTELAYRGSSTENAAAAEALLLWALAAADAPLPLDEVARAARDTLASPALLDALGYVSQPGRLFRRALVHLLIADGVRLPFPRLSAWHVDQLGQLQSVLSDLALHRRSRELGPAQLWVATAMVSCYPTDGRSDAAIRLIERETAGFGVGALPADLMATLVNSAVHDRLSPRARGVLLWWALVSATAEGTIRADLHRGVEALLRLEVACDLWPHAPPGAPVLTLESVAALVDLAFSVGAFRRCESVIIAAAERVGRSERERGAALAIAGIAQSMTLLQCLCTAQNERDPRDPLPVSAEVNGAVADGRLARAVGAAVEAALPEEQRTLRLRIRRGWK